jgi:hypothetical protein
MVRPRSIHARQAVELDVVAPGVAAQGAAGVAAQVPHVAKVLRKAVHRRLRQGQQLAHGGVARGVVGRGAALFNLAQAVLQRGHQGLAALRVVQQVVFKVRVALHHPDVAQHLVQHARAAAGAALGAQAVQHGPGALAQQAQHDLPVGEGGVVVGYFAQAGRGVVRRGG